MTTAIKIRGFLAAARLPNLPGVACHVVSGAMIAMWLSAGEAFDAAASAWVRIAIAALAGVLLCVAGNLLNDWHDRDWDARYRPERALPSGHFHPGTFLRVGLACLALGLGGAFTLSVNAGWVALGIVACILIYTRFHKRTGFTIVPLAMCRGLLPLMGAFAIGADIPFPTVLALCGSLFLWTCGLSLDARGESTGAVAWSSLAWSLLIAAPLLSAWMVRDFDGFPWTSAAPAMLWLVMVRGPYRHSAKSRVSALLAGLPLLDFVVLATIWGAVPGLSMAFLWIPFLAFALGRVLQRAAAAT